MNFIDIIILIPALWGFWRGFMKGVVMEVATLAAFFLGVWGGMKLSDLFAELLRSWLDTTSPYIPLISFGIIFISILLAVFAVAKVIERTMEKTALGIFNKLLGGAFGCMKFLLIMSVLLFVIDAIEKSVNVVPRDVKEHSLLYQPVAAIAPAIIPGLHNSDLGKMIPSAENSGVDVNIHVNEDTINVR